MDIFKTDALVLRSSRWSESSKIVHLFTADQGYVKVIAKGALQSKSQFRGVLETLNLIEAVVSHKESRGLQLITSASLLNSFQRIRDDLNKTAIAFSMLEVIQQLLRTHEPLREFFDYTTQLLEKINSHQQVNDFQESDPRIYLWHFLLTLSHSLGFGWSLEECHVCRNAPQPPQVYLDYENGAVICQKCVSDAHRASLPIPHEQWQFLREFSERSVEDMGSALAGKPEIDFTNILLNHLAYHTDTSLRLNALKWYG